MKLVLIGSCKFIEDMKEIAGKLSQKGIECFLPEPAVSEEAYAKEYSMEKLLEMKPIFTKRHCKKIENSDAVLVVNNERKGIKGYLGSNTLMELAVAFHFDKQIFFLNSFDKDHPHYEELAGLNVTILNGDFNKLSL